jgi:hypothetical protein
VLRDSVSTAKAARCSRSVAEQVEDESGSRRRDVVVCVACGTYEVARTKRAWTIDRAMKRSDLAEREVRAALALLIEAGADPDLDQLDGEKPRELHALVGEDVDFEAVRAKYESARRVASPRSLSFRLAASRR